MTKHYDIGDTIAAISTPTGIGGIGIVRLSGPEALAIADQMFKTRKGVLPSACRTYTVHYGDVVKGSDVVDEALLTVMKAPRSYTCEDVVEISCHGGSAAVNAIFKLVLSLGARVAGPGEFTKRAFLNGRIDLTQAEAVLDVIRAKTEAGLSIFEHQLKGELTQRLEDVRKDLMDFYVQLEADVNFPEDDSESQGGNVKKVFECIEKKITKLLASADQGRVAREGIKVVLCGKPNVGKSLLMNVLLKQPRAIVSKIEGTTRDAIEETAQIGGIPMRIVDTAGILLPRDEIEEEAVKRSHVHIEDADLVLFLVDASLALSDKDFELAKKLADHHVMIVLNKSDLRSAVKDKDVKSLIPGAKILRISSLTQKGIDRLLKAVLDDVLHGRKIEPENIILSNVRHIDLLQKALREVQEARFSYRQKISLEFISEYLKRAVQQLDRITGRDIDVDLVDQIFSEFCIGK